jgi:hypothetical protein
MTVVINGTTGITSPDVDSSLNGLAYPDASSMGFRNRIINGDMRIDQRNAGASVTPTAGQYVVDRFQFDLTQASKFTAQRNAGAVTPPVGFTNYLGMTSSSAYAVVSSDFFRLIQKIEGFNCSDFAWGTASAQTFTLSFWVRSSLTGTFGGAFRNAAGNRSYPFSYAISSANTWEQKTIVVAGDTTGTWATDNTSGIELNWSLGAGATFSGTAGAWSGSNLISATGATSVVGTSGATFYITGVQLEAGSVASPFERRDYGRELMMCQRYYQFVGGTASGFPLLQGYTTSGTTLAAPISFPVVMRASPTTIVIVGTWALSNAGNLRADFAGPQGFTLRADAVATGTLNAFPNSTDDAITFSAEL